MGKCLTRRGIIWVFLYLLVSSLDMPCYSQVEPIRTTIEILSSVDSRLAGYPGAEYAADWLEQQFREVGVGALHRDAFEVVVPIDEGSVLSLEVDGEQFDLWGLWPNLVRTSTVASEGIQGPMIYGGQGEWDEFNGYDLDGRIVLMEFDSWNHWLRAAALGARAIVLIAPEELTRYQADAKYAQVPLDVPRFWIDRTEGERLRQVLERGEATVHLRSRMSWQRRPAWNIWGIIEGTDPELAHERIAVEAYYDGISLVPARAPSAETACSVAALLELARYLRQHPPARTVVLVATSAHFLGRQGISNFLDRYARRHPSYASRITNPLTIDLFIGLDLSSRSDQIGIWNNTSRPELRRFFAPFGRRFTGYADSLRSDSGGQVMGRLVNGITPIKGLDWSTYMPGGIVTDSQLALDAGLISLGLITVNDGRFRVDSPLDNSDEVNYDNLERQIHLVNGIIKQAAADPHLLDNKAEFEPVLKDRLRALQVKVRTFPRRSQVPDKPVGNAVVALRTPLRANAIKGVRNVRVYLSDAQGELTIAGLPLGQYPISAYVLDPANGAIRYATDLSKRAEGHHGVGRSDGSLNAAVQWAEPDQMIVVFPCVSQPFYGLVNPRFLNFLNGVKILNKDDMGLSHFGFALGAGIQEAAGVVFAPFKDEPKNRIKILAGNQLLLLNNGGDGSDPRGSGFSLSQDRLIPTVMQATADMWRLNEARLQSMRDHAIENQYLQRLHQRTAILLDDARAAMATKEWDRYVEAVRGAMSIEAQVYPQIRGILNDVIKGIVFFLALLIPAAFLAERLLLSAAQITRQLVGFIGMLALVWLAISQVHPAFSIAHPLIVLMAFVIMAMACFVLVLILSRFNSYMKERGDRVHNVDVNRFSVVYAAFMLGISNMRRRKLRTGLTLITLVLLTFTVLSFASFEVGARSFAVPLRHDGAYEGILIRDRNWDSLSQPLLEHVSAHFDTVGSISPRNWYILKEDKKAYLEIGRGQRLANTYGILGLSPQEPAVTGVTRALIAGDFFDATDRDVCLLPERMAEALGIGFQDMGRAQVQIMGKMLTVQGIVDAAVLHQIKDLDDGLLTPVDFEMSNSDINTNQRLERVLETENVVSQYRPYNHLGPEDVLIVPYETVRQMGGSLRSIAIAFNSIDAVDKTPQESQALIEDFLSRIAVNLFVGMFENDQQRIRVAAYSSFGTTAVKGVSILLIPMLIAALIVLNTMLGAVYERLKDIGIYSAVGLAPLHIFFLFMAEACAYAVLGITLGYLGGQGLGLLLKHFDLLAGLNLNYSSLAAVFSALVVMAVVLLSTYYPARVAARTAVPDVVRRWQPEPPVGGEWEFRFPFLVSAVDVKGLCGFLKNYLDSNSEVSLGTFYTEGTLLQAFDVPTGTAYALEAKAWLAPLDLGVSQHVVLCAQPEENPDIYALIFYLRCLSGDNDSWQRANRNFLQDIRKELLIWNTLKAPERITYREQADTAMV